MAQHTIDITPQWKNLVPLFISWLQTGTESQRQTAKEHIEQMAEIADIVKDNRELIQDALDKAGIEITITTK